MVCVCFCVSEYMFVCVHACARMSEFISDNLYCFVVLLGCIWRRSVLT